MNEMRTQKKRKKEGRKEGRKQQMKDINQERVEKINREDRIKKRIR